MANFVQQLVGPIRTEQGFTGTQRVNAFDDGTTELAEIVLTRTPQGEQCQHVFARRSDLAARVYGLADLAPYGSWELTGPMHPAT